MNNVANVLDDYESNTALALRGLLIINPQSRYGGEADINAGIDLLKSAGFQLTQVESKSAKNTAELIDKYSSKIDLVIIGGGDGSISSAAESLYRHQLPFAILPLGTANDLARSLGMTNDVMDAFNNIAANNRRKINLGVVNGRYFFNAAHIGLGVDVTHELTPELKKQWGVFSYLKAVFAAFKSNRSFRVSITVDGNPRRLRSIQLGIGNGRYYGGGNIIDDNSTIQDGQLCLYNLPPLSFWKLLILGPLLRAGKQRMVNQIFCTAGQRIEIKTSKPREIHADGEPVSTTPAIFEVIPEALEVILPDTAKII